ncbi:EAL domain-containing protein [Cohnella yongneupensis]|uniref:EAL domain-containing protein n=1 Tax=Cohnella yongneupensis TaxID=425006 RepID=A0ABW0QZF2_9BACL
MDKKRVLVVDDSAVMRRMVSVLLEEEGGFEVVGTAVNGVDALQKVGLLLPDLVTMDIEMPEMDGLTALGQLMEIDALPVIVLSTHAHEGSMYAIRALELGAVDFFHKDKLLQHPRNRHAEEEFLLRCQAALTSRPLLRRGLEAGHKVKLIKELLEMIAGMLQEESCAASAISGWRSALGLNGLYLKLRREGGRFVVVDGEGSMLRKLGYQTDILVNREIEELFPVEHIHEWLSHCERAWNGEASVSYDKDWKSLSVMTVFRPIRREGEVVEVIALSVDTSEQRRLEARMHDMANHDLLTGLPNRRYLVSRLGRAVQEMNGFAVLSVNLDHLKLAVDTLGQEIGDQLLQLIARRLRSSAIGQVNVFRSSGNQFLCLLPNASREDASVFADKIIEAIRQPIRLGGHDVYLSASVGVSLYPQDHADAEHLIRYAEIAKDQAELQGGDNCQFYDPRYQRLIQRRMEIEFHLRKALENNELLLQYQPEMCITDHRIVGFESLVRWNSPKLGLVSPAEFIPVAEETGLIYQLGEWVLREACRQNRKWQDAGISGLFVAVNLSSRQFYDQKLADKVGAILQETGLSPKGLELEITESMTMNRQSATPTLQTLRQLGLSVALDDFGTGYSSLAYLKELQIDKLKIDRSFVSEITKSTIDASIVNTIITLCKDLKLCVTAEGVESEEELLLLSQLGCNIAQGFLLSKPIDADQVPGFLKRFSDGSVASIS